MASRLRRERWTGLNRSQFVALAVLTLACFSLAAQSRPDASGPTPEQEFQAAITARDQGDLDRASLLLQNLRHRHPGLFAVDESLGLIYVAQEKYAEALPLLQAAVREQPSSDVAHSNLGADLFKLKRNREALSEFTEAARLNPQNPMTQQGLGELLLDAGKPAEAAIAFNKALASKPNDPDLKLSLATAWVAARNFDRANAVLEKFPAADNSADAQVLLGQVEEGKGHPVEAARHFDRAVQLEPTEANVWMLGVEFLRHWTFDAAISEFEVATQKFPESTRMKLALGAAYFGDQKYGKAVPVFADLLTQDKNNALYAELLGMACNAVSESARPQCSALLAYAEAHPRDAKASTYAAEMLLDEEQSKPRLEQARSLLGNALSADPKSANAQFEMGQMKQDEGDWKGSIVNLETAVRLKPDLAQAHYRLALAYWRSGRKEEAQAQMALHKKYSQQEQKDLDRRLREITVFVMDVKK